MDFDNGRGKYPSASAGQLAGAGIQFAISIILSLLGGQWLDKKFGTSPALLIFCVFAGTAAAFYSMYRKLMAANAEDDAAKNKK